MVQPWGFRSSLTASKTVWSFCFCPISDWVTSATFSFLPDNFSVNEKKEEVSSETQGNRGEHSQEFNGYSVTQQYYSVLNRKSAWWWNNSDSLCLRRHFISCLHMRWRILMWEQRGKGRKGDRVQRTLRGAEDGVVSTAKNNTDVNLKEQTL